MLQLDRIHQGDCIQLLNNTDPEWVDLCFADPPFNIGYRYHNYDDRKDVDEYLDFSRTWMKAVHRALKPSGSFYLAIGDEFASDLCCIARRELGFFMRNWIVWHYTFGQQTKKKFALSHTHILYFTKEKLREGNVPKGKVRMPFTFNADAVRVASARQTTYADTRANPKGKLPDDVWFLRPQETNYVEPGFAADDSVPSTEIRYFDPASDTWYVSRVCGTFREREGWHGCQMPVGVLDRIIRASSNPGDVVLDPFNGSGTTVVSASLLGRRFVGLEQSREYVEFARKRLDHAIAARDQNAPMPQQAPVESEGLFHSAVLDVSRKSRKLTATDAFGRPRVSRTRAGRSVVAPQ
jgi:site-specific DNA-methyltransferase (adenine-specific)